MLGWTNSRMRKVVPAHIRMTTRIKVAMRWTCKRYVYDVTPLAELGYGPGVYVRPSRKRSNILRLRDAAKRIGISPVQLRSLKKHRSVRVALACKCRLPRLRCRRFQGKVARPKSVADKETSQ